MKHDPPSEDLVDWHWLAGIFEGEGYAGVCNPKNTTKPGNRRTVLRVAISQRETSMLLEVDRIAGCGRIHPANRADGGELFMWHCSCANARKFLTMLLPFIRSSHKREQVKVALAADAAARTAGALIIRETLARNSAERWRKYRESYASV